jgi:hypothetical protein
MPEGSLPASVRRAEAADESGLDQRGVFPVRATGDVGQRQARPAGGMRACCLARSGARSYSGRPAVLREPSVVLVHLSRGVRQQCHQRHAGVDQRGCVGVTQPGQ